MALKTIPQGTGLEGNYQFHTAAGLPAIPTTAHWRITDSISEQVLLDWQQATVSPELSGGELTKASISLEVPGSANVLVDRNALREKHLLTICADKDLSSECSRDFAFYVVRSGRGTP